MQNHRSSQGTLQGSQTIGSQVMLGSVLVQTEAVQVVQVSRIFLLCTIHERQDFPKKHT